MKRSNVTGKLGNKNETVLIQYIKSLTFQHYPLESFETEKQAWTKCVLAIDESNRRLNKKLIKSVLVISNGNKTE